MRLRAMPAPRCGNADCGIALVAAVRQQHHRHTGRERFHDGPMSAMRNHRGRVSQHLTMRCVRNNADIGDRVQRRRVDGGTRRDDGMDWAACPTPR